MWLASSYLIVRNMVKKGEGRKGKKDKSASSVGASFFLCLREKREKEKKERKDSAWSVRLVRGCRSLYEEKGGEKKKPWMLGVKGGKQKKGRGSEGGGCRTAVVIYSLRKERRGKKKKEGRGDVMLGSSIYLLRFLTSWKGERRKERAATYTLVPQLTLKRKGGGKRGERK